MRNTNTVRLTFCTVFACVLALVSPAFATTNADPVQPLVVAQVIELSAEVSGTEVTLNWSESTNTDFLGYKVVASTTEESPVYPDDGYVKWETEQENTEFTFDVTPNATTYIRICVLNSDHVRVEDSNVVTVVAGDSTCPDSDTDDCDDDSPDGEDDPEVTLSLDYERDGYLIELSWTPSEREDFSGYKVVYSTEDSEPVYPEAAYEAWITERDQATQTSDPHPDETTYYRVCVLDLNHEVVELSNVVEIPPLNHVGTDDDDDGDGDECDDDSDCDDDCDDDDACGDPVDDDDCDDDCDDGDDDGNSDDEYDDNEDDEQDDESDDGDLGDAFSGEFSLSLTGEEYVGLNDTLHVALEVDGNNIPEGATLFVLLQIEDVLVFVPSFAFDFQPFATDVTAMQQDVVSIDLDPFTHAMLPKAEYTWFALLVSDEFEVLCEPAVLTVEVE